MTARSRLLHVFATFSPGGPQVRAAELMDRMAGTTRHAVIAMDSDFACADRIRKAEVDLLEPPSANGFLGTGRAFQRILKQLEPDLVLTYNWGSIEAVLGAKLAKFDRLVHHEEGFGPEETKRYLQRRIWARRLLLPSARAVAVPSRVLERVALDRWKLGADRVRYLPNGVDIRRFRVEGSGEGSASSETNDVVVGSVAHFRGEKNQALLVEAFARCSARDRARLLLVGDGPERPRVEALAEQLGVADRVDFAGPADDTAPVYRRLDVFALSSRTEQMPLVVLEAMASGLPVASTDVGDVARMIAPENRPHVVAPDDPDALAGALDRLVTDASHRGSLGRANRRRAEAEYEADRCLDAWISLYEEAAGNRLAGRTDPRNDKGVRP